MSDLATKVVEDFQAQQLAELESEITDLDSESIKEVKYQSYRKLHTKLNPKWKAEDESAVFQLKAAAEAVYLDIYQESFLIIDELYQSIRVPEVSRTGSTRLDPDGRIIWQRKADGSFVEDWSTLTGQDIDVVLMKLGELRLITSQRTKTLFLEAIFAKYSLDDDWHESYEKSLEGTGPIREAKANRESQQARYHFLFRYWIFSMCDGFEKEITSFMKTLEKIRYWRIQELR